MKWSAGPKNAVPVRFAYDQFQFPSCVECNSIFSELEELAKIAIQKILALQPIDRNDLENLLDWFDKIRVGLWVGHRSLGTGFMKTERPKFFIRERLRHSDRALYLTIILGSISDGLSFCGTSSPVFGLMPSVFGLRINNLLFTNLSFTGMLSQRCGVHYPVDARYKSETGVRYHPRIEKGSGKFRLPLMPFNYTLRSKKIFQPMFGSGSVEAIPPEFRTEWLSKILVEDGSLSGKILSQTSEGVVFQDGLSETDFEQATQLTGRNITKIWTVDILKLQNWAAQGAFWGEEMSIEEYSKRREYYAMMRSLNKKLIKETEAGRIL